MINVALASSWEVFFILYYISVTVYFISSNGFSFMVLVLVITNNPGNRWELWCVKRVCMMTTLKEVKYVLTCQCRSSKLVRCSNISESDSLCLLLSHFSRSLQKHRWWKCKGAISHHNSLLLEGFSAVFEIWWNKVKFTEFWSNFSVYAVEIYIFLNQC